MEPCNNPNVPQHLHTGNRPDLPQFFIAEKLFRRCKLEEIEQPFDYIRLFDLSVNREGSANQPLCREEDVLRNLVAMNEDGLYFKDSVVTLTIKELSQEGLTYKKEIPHTGVNEAGIPFNHSCQITLLHDKIPCNYAHSVFEVRLNGEIVTHENYKVTLGKEGKVVSELRTRCKIELTKMVTYRTVQINW